MADLPPIGFESAYLDPELWLKLEPWVKERRRQIAVHILSGQIKDYVDYRQKLGEYLGLTSIFDQAEELMKQDRRED